MHRQADGHEGHEALAGFCITASDRRMIALQIPSLDAALPAKAGIGDRRVDFQFQSRAEVNSALDLLRTERCEIEALIPTHSTLEEVFVKTVESAVQ